MIIKNSEVNPMIVYKRKISLSIGKWILAVVVFVAAMTITWDDVEGAAFCPETTDQVQSVL